ncbi:hypothetical protein ACLB2K_067785 [Fragaria x ananassa]
MAANKAEEVAILAAAPRGRYINKRKVSGLRRCFRHNEKPPVESPAQNKEEIKQRVVELPEEIIVEILLKLPFKYMIQFSCVSKKWRSLILHDPQFSKTHYKVASQQRTLGQSLLVSSQIKLPSTWTAYNLSDPNFQSLQDLAGDHHVPNSFLSSPFKKNHPGLGWFSAVQLLGSCNGLVCKVQAHGLEDNILKTCISGTLQPVSSATCLSQNHKAGMEGYSGTSSAAYLRKNRHACCWISLHSLIVILVMLTQLITTNMLF